MSEQRADRFPFGPAILIGIAVSLFLIWSGWAQISTRSGWDPDDQLRLVQLRDFLGGQSWFDTTQYRMNAPQGAPMHWSRLIELPLALIVTLASPLVGVPRAEMLAGTIVPLSILTAIAFLLAAITRRFGGNRAALIALVLAYMAPAILMQNRPMRIDHHGWQIAMAVLALWSLFRENRKTGGLVLGLALSVWLHISLEGAPLTAAFFLLLGWRWITEKGEGVRLFWTLVAFSIASFALFFGTQAQGLWAAQYCDTISPVHIVAIGAATAILLPVIHLRPAHKRWRIAAVLVAGGAVLGAMLAMAPQCATGAFAEMDPVVRDYWYVSVREGLPVWRQSSNAAWSLLAGPLVGLFAIGWLWRSRRTADFATLAFLVGYAVLLSLLVFRTVSVASAFAVVPAALAISALFDRWQNGKRPLVRVGLVAAMLVAALPGAFAGSAIKVFAAKQPAEKTARKASSKACEAVTSLAHLNLLPDSSFVAPFDMGPAMLMTTRHRVLASSHHRNQDAMRDQIDIFRLPEAQAHKIIQRRGITRIAACFGEAELELYARRDPDGLWAQLAKADPPEWLVPDGIYGEGIMVWRVKR
ncbi:hypothetical protein [Sphingorhabdus sp.]|uniref:hypothetical protein n=1 Tax=Sphingorhabdus sp. TaxID=1902408 RepID=UPI003C78D596